MDSGPFASSSRPGLSKPRLVKQRRRATERPGLGRGFGFGDPSGGAGSGTDSGVFVFDSKKSSGFGGGSSLHEEMRRLGINDSGSYVSSQELDSTLREEIRRLNIGKDGDDSESGIVKPNAHKTGSVSNAVNDQMRNLNAEGSASGISISEVDDVDRYDSELTGEGEGVDKLHEKVKNLNLSISGSAGGYEANVDDGSNVANDHVETAKNFSAEDNLNVLPEAIAKMNIGDGETNNTENGKKDSETSSFLFQSILEKTNHIVDDSMSKLPEGIQKLKIEDPGFCRNSFEETKDEKGVHLSSDETSSPGTRGEVPVTGSGSPQPRFTDSKSAQTDFIFTTRGTGEPGLDHRPVMDDATVASLFSQDFRFSEMFMHKNLAPAAKKGTTKDSKLKKRRAMVKPAQDYLKKSNIFTPNNSYSRESSRAGSPDSYSPMDYSPYQETLVSDPCPTFSVASSQFASHDSPGRSGHMQQPFDANVEGVTAQAQHLVAEECDMGEDFREDSLRDENDSFVDAESSFAEEICEPSQEDDKCIADKIDVCHDLKDDSTETKTRFSTLNTAGQSSEGRAGFSFNSLLHGQNESSFAFTAAASTAEHSFSTPKQLDRKKNHTNHGLNVYNTLDTKFIAAPKQPNLPKAPSIPEKTKEVKIIEMKRATQFNQEPEASASVAIKEACEEWRLRGNQAYAKGNLSKADAYYTCGINCVPPSEQSRSCNHALMLCYSNRAATRMSLGRMKDALKDCMMAIEIDPKFLKAQVRAANCHLALGETEVASRLFINCIKLMEEDKSDLKMCEEASDGLIKVQQVIDHMSRSAELLQKKTYADATDALQTISEALLLSPQSDCLIEMKAEALLKLKRYKEVIELCQKTINSSENSGLKEGELGCTSDHEIWLLCLILRSYFYLGRLEEALALLEKHKLSEKFPKKSDSNSLKSFISLASNIQELLRLKTAGNTAFLEGRNLEAVEQYTAAIACSVESLPFAAICFCNRAAAYQALGQVTDAIADCNLAIALDANYPKAISRRATLHEMIRDYGQASLDLNRLISLLDSQNEDQSNQSGTLGSSTLDRNNSTQARMRLSDVEEEARKGIPLDMYKILGIESMSSPADIKKAYRKAALRHHPDKAAQLLVKGDSVDEKVWKDVSDEVRRDSDRLFKMIGESYAVLSDPLKRMQYDADEEKRTISKSGGTGRSRRFSEDSRSSSGLERSRNRDYSEGPRSPHGSSYRRWSEYPYSSRYF